LRLKGGAHAIRGLAQKRGDGSDQGAQSGAFGIKPANNPGAVKLGGVTFKMRAPCPGPGRCDISIKRGLHIDHIAAHRIGALTKPGIGNTANPGQGFATDGMHGLGGGICETVFGSDVWHGYQTFPIWELLPKQAKPIRKGQQRSNEHDHEVRKN
jgi:hypothetical protein